MPSGCLAGLGARHHLELEQCVPYRTCASRIGALRSPAHGRVPVAWPAASTGQRFRRGWDRRRSATTNLYLHHLGTASDRAGLARLNQAAGVYGVQEPTWSPNHKSMRRKRLSRPTKSDRLSQGGAKGIRTPDLLVAKAPPAPPVGVRQRPARCMRCIPTHRRSRWGHTGGTRLAADWFRVSPAPAGQSHAPSRCSCEYEVGWRWSDSFVPGMKYREGPRVVLLARRLEPGIRCDRPNRGLRGTRMGRPFLHSGLRARVSRWPPLRLVRLLCERVSVGVVPSSGSPR